MSIGFVVALVFVTGISSVGVAQEGGVKAKEAEVAAAQDRLMDIRMETSAAQAAYNNALYEMNQLNGQISQATEDLDAAKERLAEAQAELEERASQVYKSGNVAFMDVLVGVDDFSEFATRLDLWVRLLGEERAKVEAVEEAKDELAARKRDLEEQRTQRVDAVDKAIAQKERAEDAEKEAEDYLGSLNAELREALQNKQDRQAEMALAVAEEIKDQKTPVPAPTPAPDEPAPIPEVEVAEVKQVPVEQPDLQDEQAAADRAAAAEAAAREAERLAEQRAAEREAAREAAEQAAAAQAAAEQAAEREARQDAKAAAEREAELAAQRAAERQAAREAAEREAEIAAQRAAAERAAAQQAADEREAARLAAQRRAERQAAAEAASAAATEEAQAAQEAAEQADASASAAAQEETTGGRPPQDASASASASAAPAAPVGGGGASGSGTSVIAEGQQYLGTPYVLGGTESCVPYEMMDCSCFTMTVYSAFGIALPDSPGGQMGYGSPVSGAPMAGDLLFWSEDGSGYITHVGIAMGDGTAIHASTYTGNVTQGTPISSIPGYAGARRLL